MYMCCAWNPWMLMFDYTLFVECYLTPNSLTVCLFVWMGRRLARLVALLYLWLCLRTSFGATSSFLWSLSLGIWLGCQSFVIYFHVLMRLLLNMLRFEINIWWCTTIYVAWLLWRFIYLLMICYIWYYSCDVLKN